MTSLPFFDEAAPQPVRAPQVQIDIASGGDDSGFGGLADAAAQLLGGAGEASWADHLVALTLVQDVAPAVGWAELQIADAGDAPQAALEDSGTISMGPAGEPQLLFSGAVTGLERRGDGLRRYRLGNSGHTLSRTRLSQSVCDMKVQDAISFAAQQCGLSVNAQVSGADEALPQYVFDGSRNLWQHMAYLARLRGLLLWVDSQDTLQLADGLDGGETVATFDAASDVLKASLWLHAQHSGAVTAHGGGRVNAGFILRKQGTPNRGSAGEGAPQRFYRDGALQSQQDLAGRAGAAQTAGARRSSPGELLVVGNPAVASGAIVELTGMPNGGDGKYLVQRVEHRLDHRRGWCTRLSVSEAGAGAGAGMLGGLL